MTANNPPPAPDEKPTPGPQQTPANLPPAGKPPEPKPKRRRRWPWILGGVIVLLLIVLMLLPTLLSMGWARELVVNQINHRINGRAEIADWSLGWFSGTRIDGLVIYDQSNRQILQLPHLSTGLSLWNAIRGHYNIGKTEVNQLDVLVSREPDGTLNWAHLTESGSKPATEGQAPSEPAAAKGTDRPAEKPAPQPTKVPDVRGELVLNNCTITYEAPSSGAQPVYLRSIQGDVKIPDINQPITDSLSTQAQIGSAQPGSISLSGTLAAVKNNALDQNTPTVDQTLKLNGVELAAISGFLGPKQKLDLAGRTDAQAVLQLTNGTDGSIEASLVSNGFAAAGSALNGAHLKSDGLNFQLPHTSLQFPKGLADTTSAKVRIGAGTSTGMLAQLKNATLTAGEGAAARNVIANDTFTVDVAGGYAADANVRDLSLERLDIGDTQGIVSIKKAPESPFAATLPATGTPTAQGSIDLAADLKRLNDIAQALEAPQVKAKDQNGMELQNGRLQGRMSLAQANAGQIQLTGNLALTQLTVGNATNVPLKDQTIQVTLQALADHNLSQVDVPQLRVAGDVLTADVTDTQLNLASSSAPKSSAASPLQKLVKATATVQVPSLPKLQALARAFSLPKPAATGKGGNARSSESKPIEITGGSAAITLRATPESGGVHLLPQMQVTNLALDGRPYPEQQIEIGGDIVYGTESKTVDIRNLTAKTVTTNALNLVVQGRVTDLGGAQKIDNVLAADLDYDAAPLWRLILPFLSKSSQEKMQSAQVAGKYHKKFEVRGAYPSGQEFAKAVQQLLLQGDLQLDLFDGQGVTLRQVAIPVVLQDGVLRITYPAGASTQPVPPPAYLNGGTLDIGGCAVDLRGEHMLLTTPKGLKLVQNATLNPIFASWSLGWLLNNPLFVNASQATGLLSVTVDNCDRLPLDSAITSPNDGNATLDISIMGLHIGNPFLEQVAEATRVNLNSFQGNVKQYRVVIANGVIHQDFTMTVGEHQRPLHLAGDVRKSNNQMLGFNLELPLKDLGVNLDKNVAGFLPDTITVPLGGTADNPKPQVDLGKIIADATQKAIKQNVLGGLIPGSTTQPADQNPVQQLEDLFGGKKKKQKK